MSPEFSFKNLLEASRKKSEKVEISRKSAYLLTHLGEIRDVTNGKVRENLILDMFNETIREVALETLEKGLTGFCKITIQSISDQSWQTFSGEDKSLEESLITPKEISDLNKGLRGKDLNSLYRLTKEQNEAYCRPGIRIITQDDVSTIDKIVKGDQSHSARVVLTFGYYNAEMTEEQRVRNPFNIGSAKGMVESEEVLNIGWGRIINRLNAALEQVDSVSSFLQAPADVWKKVFGAAA